MSSLSTMRTITIFVVFTCHWSSTVNAIGTCKTSCVPSPGSVESPSPLRSPTSTEIVGCWAFTSGTVNEASWLNAPSMVTCGLAGGLIGLGNVVALVGTTSSPVVVSVAMSNSVQAWIKASPSASWLMPRSFTTPVPRLVSGSMSPPSGPSLTVIVVYPSAVSVPGATASGAVLVATTSVTDLDDVRRVMSLAVAVMVNSSPSSALAGAVNVAAAAGVAGSESLAPSQVTVGVSPSASHTGAVAPPAARAGLTVGVRVIAERGAMMYLLLPGAPVSPLIADPGTAVVFAVGTIESITGSFGWSWTTILTTAVFVAGFEVFVSVTVSL